MLRLERGLIQRMAVLRLGGGGTSGGKLSWKCRVLTKEASVCIRGKKHHASLEDLGNMPSPRRTRSPGRKALRPSLNRKVSEGKSSFPLMRHRRGGGKSRAQTEKKKKGKENLTKHP